MAFGMPGFLKISMPMEGLVKNGMGFVNNYEADTVLLIGICEVLGAIGLILPAALRIKSVLTPLAAAGIAIIMVLATHYHFADQEPIVPTLVLFLMASFVAWGRYKMVPILAK